MSKSGGGGGKGSGGGGGGKGSGGHGGGGGGKGSGGGGGRPPNGPSTTGNPSGKDYCEAHAVATRLVWADKPESSRPWGHAFLVTDIPGQDDGTPSG